MKNLRAPSFAALALCLWLVSCQSEEEKKEILEKKIRKALVVSTNTPLKSLTISPQADDKGVYFVEVELESGRKMQLAAAMIADSLAWKETFNSQLAWIFSQELNNKCVSLVLRPIEKSTELTGVAVMATGDTIKFFAQEGRGWRPANDLPTLTTLTKTQVGSQGLADSLDRFTEFVLAPDSAAGTYKGYFATVKNPAQTKITVKWTPERFDWQLQQ